MGSARQQPTVITEYLKDELARGPTLGPLPLSMRSVHINRFGVTHKGRNTGKWRLITDLSFPQGQSVNDGIDPLFCSLAYIMVEKIAKITTGLGMGALMVKIDIESAYHLIPVHSQGHTLQAVKWDGKIFVDTMIPFSTQFF